MKKWYSSSSLSLYVAMSFLTRLDDIGVKPEEIKMCSIHENYFIVFYYYKSELK